MICKNYSIFKKKVLENCNFICENPHCDSDCSTVHHFFKRSKYPEFKLDTDNGMGACGPCHAEIERRLRTGENWQELVPMDRFLAMGEKI